MLRAWLLLLAVAGCSERALPLSTATSDLSAPRDLAAAPDMAWPCPRTATCKLSGACTLAWECCTNECADGFCTRCRHVGDACTGLCECCNGASPLCQGGASILGPM